MSEFVCPKNPKHTLKPTDHDDRFTELTCVSCGSRTYKPKAYSQRPVEQSQSGTDMTPESYIIMDDVQDDIDDEEEAFNLMCSETTRLY